MGISIRHITLTLMRRTRTNRHVPCDFAEKELSSVRGPEHSPGGFRSVWLRFITMQIRLHKKARGTAGNSKPQVERASFGQKAWHHRATRKWKHRHPAHHPHAGPGSHRRLSTPITVNRAVLPVRRHRPRHPLGAVALGPNRTARSFVKPASLPPSVSRRA